MECRLIFAPVSNELQFRFRASSLSSPVGLLIGQIETINGVGVVGELAALSFESGKIVDIDHIAPKSGLEIASLSINGGVAGQKYGYSVKNGVLGAVPYNSAIEWTAQYHNGEIQSRELVISKKDGGVDVKTHNQKRFAFAFGSLPYIKDVVYTFFVESSQPNVIQMKGGKKVPLQGLTLATAPSGIDFAGEVEFGKVIFNFVDISNFFTFQSISSTAWSVRLPTMVGAGKIDESRWFVFHDCLWRKCCGCGFDFDIIIARQGT